MHKVVEHSLALITPEGAAHERRILSTLRKEGFLVLDKRTVHLTPEQVTHFYQDRYGRLDFPLLVAATSMSPVVAALVGRPDAVGRLKEVAGSEDVHLARRQSPPATLNALYGNERCNLPAVHASQDFTNARREIRFFFPHSLVEPPPSLEDSLCFLDREVRTLLRQGLERLAKQKPTEPMLLLADWLMANVPDLPLAPLHMRHTPHP